MRGVLNVFKVFFSRAEVSSFSLEKIKYFVSILGALFNYLRFSSDLHILSKKLAKQFPRLATDNTARLSSLSRI